MLIRTIHSVISRSSPNHLKEIILVDDASDQGTYIIFEYRNIFKFRFIILRWTYEEQLEYRNMSGEKLRVIVKIQTETNLCFIISNVNLCFFEMNKLRPVKFINDEN